MGELLLVSGVIRDVPEQRKLKSTASDLAFAIARASDLDEPELFAGRRGER